MKPLIERVKAWRDPDGYYRALKAADECESLIELIDRLERNPNMKDRIMIAWARFRANLRREPYGVRYKDVVHLNHIALGKRAPTPTWYVRIAMAIAWITHRDKEDDE